MSHHFNNFISFSLFFQNLSDTDHAMSGAQRSMPIAEAVDCSAGAFDEPQSLIADICKNISQASQPHEFVYRNVGPDWGALASDSLIENEAVEAFGARYVVDVELHQLSQLSN